MKRNLMNMLVACLGLVCTVEAVTIENVTARQRYPWNGKVDISFEVVGDPMANLPEGKVAELSVAMMDQTTGKRYTAENVTGDTGPTEGAHQIIWDLTAQSIEVYASNVVFVVAYEEKDSPYRVIDVSGGATAYRYPVLFLNGIPNGGWSDEYKTDKIVLRRIDGTNGVYYAGVFEVTEAQWDRVMGGSSASTKPKGSVSYNAIRGDAGTYDWPNSDDVAPTSFMGRLRQKTGLSTLDLPSEAEWGYAARAGVTTKWLCGDSETGLADYAWYYENSGGERHPVGTRRANAWGLYDVHGNVWEWCLNRYSSDDDFRMLRGGSYLNDAWNCAFSLRQFDDPSSDFEGGRCGFRLFCRPE